MSGEPYERGDSVVSTKRLAPDTIAMQDQIVEMLRASAPVPVSTRQITAALPPVTGRWERAHHGCPTCTCGPVWHAYWHGGVAVDNSRVTSITKRLVRAGLVERFASPVKGQPDSWRWIGA